MSPPDAPHAATPAYDLSTNALAEKVAYTTSPAGITITSLVSLPAGAVLTPITTATPSSTKRWSTVQTGPSSHIELNSGLLYMNHSCDPSLEIDTAKMEVRVSRTRDLKEGEALTFFYPSTEWEFDAPFECLCGAGGCLGQVKGAKYLDTKQRGMWWFNEHITEMMEREG